MVYIFGIYLREYPARSSTIHHHTNICHITPWFGQKYDKDKFKNDVYDHYSIMFPTNLATISPNMTMVLEGIIDTKETDGGYDYLTIGSPDGQTEYIQLSGNISVRRTYPVTDMLTTPFTRMLLSWSRLSFDQDSLDQWNDRRMTGFTLAWYFEDATGTKVEIVGEKGYVEKVSNVQFVRLANILYTSISYNEMTVGEMFENVKDYKEEWMEKEKHEYIPKCITDDVIDNYLSSLENKLNMKEINQSQITDSLLKSAAEMFIYLTYCPSSDTFNKQIYYADLFATASPRSIVEAVLNMNKVDSSQKGKKQVLPKSVVEKLDTTLKLKIGILDTAFSTKSGLLSKVNDVQFGRLRKDLQDCLQEENCKEVENHIQSLGHLQLNIILQQFK